MRSGSRVGSEPPNVAMVPVDSDLSADVPNAAAWGILMSVAVGMTKDASKIARSGREPRVRFYPRSEGADGVPT